MPQTNQHIKNSDEALSDCSSDSGEKDDGYPWFGCICGTAHETFWIQCGVCNSWHNCSPRCVGYDQFEAERRGHWKCPDCSCSSEGQAKSSSNGVTRQPQCRLDINRNERVEKKHFSYSKAIELLDNKELCGPKHVLTTRSIAVCSRLLMSFLLHEDEKSDFQRDLWVDLWNCIRYEQKLNGWELGWNSKLSEGTTGTLYYYVPKKSPRSNGVEGSDYFSSPEAVVVFICDTIKDCDKRALNCVVNNTIELFQSRLLQAHDKGISYKNNHDTQRNNSYATGGRKRRLDQAQISVQHDRDCFQKQNKLNYGDSEIIRLTEELLTAIATSDVEKYKSLCSNDVISYEQTGGLIRGLQGVAYDEMSVNSSTNRNKKVDCNGGGKHHIQEITSTNHCVQWQGEHNEVAVISYIRHEVDSTFLDCTRKEVRIWTRKCNTWINTFVCTFSLSFLAM